MTRSIAALTAICAHAYAFRPAAAAASRRMSTARSFSITETVGAADVVIFSKSWCPFCDKTKKALRGEEIEFSAVELDKRDDGADIQAELAEMTGQRTVPSGDAPALLLAIKRTTPERAAKIVENGFRRSRPQAPCRRSGSRARTSAATTTRRRRSRPASSRRCSPERGSYLSNGV
mmetsp:Transcript_12199/g.37528  ORF Transcript_12199/g.37528 Transcript_12199/m.37528 type:complete len:176 (+) Transcript_12199:209-736(+)